MMPAAVAGQVLALLTPIGGFLLSTLIFGGAVTGDVVPSIVLIVAGIILTLRARPRRSRVLGYDCGEHRHQMEDHQ
jgi:hypothetical protein